MIDYQRILITGGAGFIGGTLIRRLINTKKSLIFNLDKLSYASDLTSINNLNGSAERHIHLKVDLFDSEATKAAINQADPDIVFHLAAESHVDRSIDSPKIFIDSNVSGTFNLLEAVTNHWRKLPTERKKDFRLLHVSTDEVFGSLGNEGHFDESSKYSPRSPYSASKAASDHLVRAWHHSFGLPIIITNCSNNYGPYQFPEKLIPVVILKAINEEEIPIYGDGSNIRDWLFVEDHVDALLIASSMGINGNTYCVGGYGEKTNKEVVETICSLMDKYRPKNKPHARLIKYVKDRPGHDKRYSIDSLLIRKELGWKQTINFEEGLEKTVKWYLNNLDWCEYTLSKSNYDGERLGQIK